MGGNWLFVRSTSHGVGGCLCRKCVGVYCVMCVYCCRYTVGHSVRPNFGVWSVWTHHFGHFKWLMVQRYNERTSLNAVCQFYLHKIKVVG